MELESGFAGPALAAAAVTVPSHSTNALNTSCYGIPASRSGVGQWLLSMFFASEDMVLYGRYLSMYS